MSQGEVKVFNNNIYYEDNGQWKPLRINISGGGGGGKTIIKNIPSPIIEAYGIATLAQNSQQFVASGTEIPFFDGLTNFLNLELDSINLTQISVKVKGKYKVDFVVQCTSPTGAAENGQLWISKNGGNQVYSNFNFITPASTTRSISVVGTTILDMEINDYVSIISADDVLIGNITNTCYAVLSIVKIAD